MDDVVWNVGEERELTRLMKTLSCIALLTFPLLTATAFAQSTNAAPEVIGTIAGENTVFIAVRSEKDGRKLECRIRELL